MNIGMWKKALTVIPNVSKEEWDGLDVISKWLISTRAAVLVMTAISALLAGLFAWRDNLFFFPRWIVLTLGLVFAHASNNLLNDYVDFTRGVDEKNYFRTLYGPQPLASHLMTRAQHLLYFVVTSALALVCGIYLVWQTEFTSVAWALLGTGAFFLLFYTWPLKYVALGEVAVLIVWGPLMIGGGYYVITQRWDWNVIAVSLIYAFGVTTVIFGKHIDKIEMDRAKHIHTLPTLIGETAARYLTILLMGLPYVFIMGLIASMYVSPVLLIVLFALPRLQEVLFLFAEPRPVHRSENFPTGQGGWPLYFAPLAFWHNRLFGTLLIVGLVADTLVRIYLPLIWQ